MTFLIRYEKRDAREKYGFAQEGLFTLEPIKKGQMIWTLNTTNDPKPKPKTKRQKTKKEFLELCEKFPVFKDYFPHYFWAVDDDFYFVSPVCLPENVDEWRNEAQDENYFNHSCDPNLGYVEDNIWKIVAIRDIDAGEELTTNYQMFNIEPIQYGFICKCGTKKCNGSLFRCDQYRNVDWQKQYYKYCSKKKIKSILLP
jgi:SET domain-containing protein